jgi:glycerol uptake facilitator-like aquaporin
MNIQLNLHLGHVVGYFIGAFLFFLARFFILYFYDSYQRINAKTPFRASFPSFFPENIGWHFFATFIIFLAILCIKQNIEK